MGLLLLLLVKLLVVMFQKIADFGLAERLENPDMKHFTMCGTPNYMSPWVCSSSVALFCANCSLYILRQLHT